MTFSEVPGPLGPLCMTSSATGFPGQGDAVWCEGHQVRGKRTWLLQWHWLLRRIFLRRTAFWLPRLVSDFQGTRKCTLKIGYGSIFVFSHGEQEDQNASLFLLWQMCSLSYCHTVNSSHTTVFRNKKCTLKSLSKQA